VRLRIFNPRPELPIAGHPTVGSTFALARRGGSSLLAAINSFLGLVLDQCPSRSRGAARACRSCGWRSHTDFGEPIAEPGRVAEALGLSEAAVTGSGLPVQVGSCGAPFLLVPLTTRRAVDSAAVDGATMADLFRSAAIDALGVFLFNHGARATTKRRSIAGCLPQLGHPRGSSDGQRERTARLLSGTAQSRFNQKKPARCSASRGQDGRPSHINISVGLEKGEISRVRVGGEAVLVGRGYTSYLM